jgi:hypothetical protein
MSIALHNNTSIDSILKTNGVVLSKGAEILDLATIRLAGNHLSYSWYAGGVLEVDILCGPVVGSPRIFHEQCFAACGIGNDPAGCSATINMGTGKGRVDVDEGIHFVSVVGCPSRQGSTDFASVLDSPLDARVEANISLVWRAKTEDESYKGVGVVVKVEGRRVLSPTVVKVEEPQMVPSDSEHANKSSIRLLNENLSKRIGSVVSKTSK